MYDTGEYNVKLEIPTDNYVVYNLFPSHLETISSFLDAITVKNEKTLIVLLGAFQCLQERDFWIQPINEYAKTKPNPIVVFTGKLTPDIEYNVPQLDFLYSRISVFELVSNYYWNTNYQNANRKWDQDCDIFRTKKFYWASSKDWYTRRYILAGLVKNNLLQDALINYKCIHTDIPGLWIKHQVNREYAEHIQQECESISHLLPLPFLDNTIEFPQTDVNFYLDSLLGIITDTFYNTGVFLSEKVFNAMNYQQLFFYVGYQGSLGYLKNKGYEIFENIIDVSYDNIKEPGQRLVAARKSLIEFLNRPIDEIRDDYKKSILLIKHNKKLVQEQKPDMAITKILQDFLHEHRTAY